MLQHRVNLVCCYAVRLHTCRWSHLQQRWKRQTSLPRQHSMAAQAHSFHVLACLHLSMQLRTFCSRNKQRTSIVLRYKCVGSDRARSTHAATYTHSLSTLATVLLPLAMPPISPSTLVVLLLLLCSDVVDMAQKRCQCCVRARLFLAQLCSTKELDLLIASSVGSSSERMQGKAPLGRSSRKDVGHARVHFFRGDQCTHSCYTRCCSSSKQLY